MNIKFAYLCLEKWTCLFKVSFSICSKLFILISRNLNYHGIF
jgi:hypothetical protein